MGIHDRDYERPGGWGGDQYGGGGGGFELRMPTTANGRLMLTLVVVFLAQNLFAGLTDLLALPSDWVTDRPWRAYGLVTYALLHSTANFGHLLFNGIALFFFGGAIEERLGKREYTVFFFAAALFGGLAWTLTEHLGALAGAAPPPNSVLLGASGGIAGVLVLYALWFPNAVIYIWGVLPVPAWAVVGIGVAMDAMGVFRSGSNVAYAAHLGGALFAYLYFRYQWRVGDWLPGWVGGAGGLPDFGKMLKRRPKLKIHRESDDAGAANPVEDRVDEILRKIKLHGQESLSDEERRVLEQASRRYQKRQR